MPLRRTPRRLLVLLTVLGGLAVPLLAVAPTPSGAQAPAPATSTAATSATAAAAAAALAPTSEEHPFSQPRYLPLRGTTVIMDCYQNNHPGLCPRRDWQLNLLAPAYDVTPPVFAMGAGRFSLVQVGKPCGRSRSASFGTMIQVDHGGGVVSRYAHMHNKDLARYRRLDGKLVAAGQQIGVMGNTGARNPRLCRRHYLSFWIQRGPGANKLQMRTLTACVGRSAQAWPRSQYSSYPIWNRLPKKIGGRNTLLPRGGRRSQIPDATCLPQRRPSTPDQPRAARLDPAGTGKLVARWPQPSSSTTQSMLVVQLYRRPQRRWVTHRYVYVTGDASSVYLRRSLGIRANQVVRVILAHRNGSGWSRYSGPSNAKLMR